MEDRERLRERGEKTEERRQRKKTEARGRRG